MSKTLKIILLALVAATTTGCFKKVTMDCRYHVRPYYQAESGGVAVQGEATIAYAFAADTTQWTVASYDDALNGVLTSKTSGEKRTDAMARAEQADSTVVLQLTATPATIVVVDTANKLFGWRMTDVVENLPDLYVSITFRPWSAQKRYVEGAWRMNNEAYVAPIQPETPSEGEGDANNPDDGSEGDEGEGNEGGSNEGQYTPADPIE